ncbi:hypothetical protein Taro_014846 [Colocasia esculenta]|uniref:Protein IRON-RELATED TRANSCRIPTION FACTOR 2 n=1 Tax=Colocasia esculenta TaxID=4460 RepID=A0A843UJA9_COLES|nr:hypothetical protein [Colocasia esculenta]
MFSLSPSSLPIWPLEATTGHAPVLGENPFADHGDLEESFDFSGAGGGLFHPEVDDDGLEPNWSNPTSEEYSSTMKKRKLSHNAYERDRRKKMNTLYSSLRSLLPETDLHKKLSIPSTVSRVLQYIPELQRQVERLQRRKEEIKESRPTRVAEDKPQPGAGGVRPIISVSGLGVGEIAIQICSSGRRRKERPLSEILVYLEGEGLGLVSASFLDMGDGRALYSLHLQVKQVSSNVEPERLRKNLSCILS